MSLGESPLKKSSLERPGCGAEPHLLSRRQPLRAAALLRTLASRSRKYSLSAEFPVIGTTAPRRRAQPSRGPWNTAAPRARICRESPLTAVKLRVRLCTTRLALGHLIVSFASLPHVWARWVWGCSSFARPMESVNVCMLWSHPRSWEALKLLAGQKPKDDRRHGWTKNWWPCLQLWLIF